MQASTSVVLFIESMMALQNNYHSASRQCQCIAVIVLSILFGVSLILAISLGVASGGDGCSCDGGKCCVADDNDHGCDNRCYCTEDLGDEWSGYCEDRDPAFGAYIFFMVLSFILLVSMSIVGCCMCCNCCAPRPIVYNGKQRKFAWNLMCLRRRASGCCTLSTTAATRSNAVWIPHDSCSSFTRSIDV